MRAVALLLTALLAFALPASAADDVAAAQSVIRSQEQAFARDDATARKLWEISEKMTGLTPAQPAGT